MLCKMISYQFLILLLIIGMAGCLSHSNPPALRQNEISEKSHSKFLTNNKIISSPLRISLVMELNAPLAEVWKWIGDPSKMPQYSSGLDKVETIKDKNGQILEYTCYFKSPENNSSRIEHRSTVKVYEPFNGFISKDEEPNAFGLRNSFTCIQLEKLQNGNIKLIWNQYYESDDLRKAKAEFEFAFLEIGNNLKKKFDGNPFKIYTDSTLK